MANEEQVTLLKQGSQIWNRWREENPDVSIDLSYADLTDTDLSEANLQSAYIRNAYLNTANLHRANLCGANLSDAYLTKANLSRTNLCGANLCGANLCDANLSKTNLRGAELISADLRRIKIIGGDLSNANLRWAKVHGAVLCEAKLINADLYEAELIDADLSDADLSDANCLYADLSNSKLVHARLFNTHLEFTDLSSADLIYADLRKANLRYASLYDSDLGEANLNQTKLISANLSRADLFNATLRHADLDKAILINTDLSNADFCDADLHGADLRKSGVLNANFTRTILTGACIEDWQIGSTTHFDEVKCDYIFRTYDVENQKFSGRLPVNSNSKFSSGEFEKWMEVRKGALDTIDITFTDGINWQELFHSLKRVRERHPEAHIAMRSVEENNGVFVVRFGVESECIGDARQQLNADFESQIKLQLAEARGQIKELRDSKDSLENLLKEAIMSPKYRIEQVGNLADVNHGNMTAMIHNHYGQDTDTILQKLEALREYAKSFPEEENEATQVHLEGLGQDLQQAEKPSTARLKTRLVGLLGVALVLGTRIATATDFANNVLELADKLAVPTEALQPQLQQLKEIHPGFEW